jgi:hypothetical protein
MPKPKRLAFAPQQFEFAVRLKDGQIIGIGRTADGARLNACRQAANYPRRAGKQMMTRNTRELAKDGCVWWEVLGNVEITVGERSRQAIAAAAARRVRGLRKAGRPPKHSPAVLARIAEMRGAGATWREVAEATGITQSALWTLASRSSKKTE